MSDQNEKIAAIKVPRSFSGAAVKETVAGVHQALRDGAGMLTFDFSGAETIDSFGIGQLVALAKDLKEKKIHLRLSHLNDDMFQFFIDTGLDQIFAIEGVKQDMIDLFESSVDIRLDITVEEAGDACIFNLSGVMDHVGGTRFFRQKVLLSLAKYRKIVLNLSELTFFDSLSVSVLLKETGGELRICCPNYIIEDLFATLNINAVIPVYHTQEEALADWK